ncbi:hypothetical protein V493_00264 [Pseudogymnoascus sp. VKM F-4281 (FW-2241)]|nr:hypothetical protein V493_00264 [Pseudogymnoascus sp. VKM F-4281 (FW-2241)]
MALHNPISSNICLNAYAIPDNTSTPNFYEDFFYLDALNMFVSGGDEKSFVSCVEIDQPPQESVEIRKPRFAEGGFRGECLPPTITGDCQVTTGVLETFQVEDGEESQNRAVYAVEVLPQAADGEEPQDLEPLQSKDEQLRSPKQHTAESIQLEDDEKSDDPRSDAALESIQAEDSGKPQDLAEEASDTGASKTCQSEDVVDRMVKLRRDLFKRLRNKTCPTKDDSDTLQVLEDMINGLTSNLLDSSRYLREAKIKKFFEKFLEKYINGLDNDKFGMKERAVAILNTTQRVRSLAILRQTPLTFATTSATPICQSDENIKIGCKVAPVIDDGATTEEDVIEERTSPTAPPSKKRKLVPTIIDDGATTEEDVIEERTSPMAPSSKTRKLTGEAAPVKSPRRSLRKATSARQYVSQERKLFTTAREEVQRLIRTQRKYAKNLQNLVKDQQNLVKDQQELEEGLERIMTSIIDLGALEEEVSKEWGGK